jgi:hypothetical protein
MDGLEDIFDKELDLTAELSENTNIDQTPILEDTGNFNLFSEEPSKLNTDVLDELLKSKGITDAKVAIVDEDNIKKEVDFYELGKEEQLAILNSQDEEVDNNDLNDTEIELLNHLRSNNLTVEQFLENYKQSIIEELGGTPPPNYDIDSYDDQELFLLDQKNKYDLTEDELAEALKKELENEDLFKKKIDKTRAEYKELEDQYNATQEQDSQRQKDEEYNQFSDTMVDVAVQTPEFYGIELEDEEKDEVLSFLLDLDENGTSDFYKTLNDPKKLYEAAWFLRYGKESFDALKNAYESEISKLKKDKTTVVHRTSDKEIKSIHDLI